MNSLESVVNGFARNALRSSRVRVSDTTVDKANEHFDGLPTAEEAAITVTEMIEAEDRKEAVVSLSDINMEDDGALTIGGEQFLINDYAAVQLFTKLSKPGAAKYLCSVDSEMRAWNFNKLAQQRGYFELKVHDRVFGSGREIFAATGPSYTTMPASTILREIAALFPTEARAEYTYNPDMGRVRFDEIHPAVFFDRGGKRGDLFRPGRSWMFDDAGRGSIKATLLLLRLLCENMAMWASDSMNLMRRIHRGDKSDLLMDAMDVAMGSITDEVSAALDAWQALFDTKVLLENTKKAAEEFYQTFIPRENIVLPPVAGRQRNNAKVLSSALADAWDFEKGTSAAAIINGITRYGRNASNPEEVECLAGGLMANQRWVSSYAV